MIRFAIHRHIHWYLSYEGADMEARSHLNENSYTTMSEENNNETLTYAKKRKCTACMEEVNTENFVSWEFMNFCGEACVSKYQKTLLWQCTSCIAKVQVDSFGKYYQRLKNCFVVFCSQNCIAKYRTTVNICSFCENVKPANSSTDWIIARLQFNFLLNDVIFCSKICYNKFMEKTTCATYNIPANTTCTVCKSAKPLTIQLEHRSETQYFCSKQCLSAYSYVQLQTGAEQCSMCKKYYPSKLLEEHRFIFAGEEIRLCSNTCRNVFVFTKRKLTPCAWCQTVSIDTGMVKRHARQLPDIHFCSTNCLKKYEVPKLTLLKQRIVTQRNVATMCYAKKENKGVQVAPPLPKKVQKAVQTEVNRTLLPVPVPIYVPIPMAMYALPVPSTVPIPIPIPVPVFIPTTRNSAKGMMKEILNVKNKVPSNRLEAELLDIAALLSKSGVENDSDSDIESRSEAEDIESEEICEGDLARNFDLEWALPDTFTHFKSEEAHGLKRPNETDYAGDKKGRFEELCQVEKEALSKTTDMRLDYALGINAWKQWVSKTRVSKNAKAFKSEILSMSPEEFSDALCLFINELRKPNGDEYAPDTIYYLCLGIQHYLQENGRSDNIFYNDIYERFTDCLNEQAMKFCALYDDESHFIVTRLEEEHLWETKQLGCHSPFVLLNTLVYFNTKYYFRSTVEAHMKLSFCNVMKIQRKNSKSMVLRLYPDPVSRRGNCGRIFEQKECSENPLRCPVKLYEYYLSKCPESVKHKYDLMYLMPEKHCTPDSPLWYSTQPLSKERLSKFVNRVKMVKEINIALLSN
ncbi:zinc finger protein without children isoform X1 [Leptinotarsa decemlineata]|uniref:zinc finger protein without children isoform X1 n=2 Tax=Leptinotarsa decemlineata TaxID=7539 RepID=UPI003D308DE0